MDGQCWGQADAMVVEGGRLGIGVQRGSEGQPKRSGGNLKRSFRLSLSTAVLGFQFSLVQIKDALTANSGKSFGIIPIFMSSSWSFV